jgi:hypothetical protein
LLRVLQPNDNLLLTPIAIGLKKFSALVSKRLIFFLHKSTIKGYFHWI